MLRDWAEGCPTRSPLLDACIHLNKENGDGPCIDKHATSGHNCRLKIIRRRRMGCNARSDAKHVRSQICSRPPVCERVQTRHPLIDTGYPVINASHSIIDAGHLVQVVDIGHVILHSMRSLQNFVQLPSGPLHLSACPASSAHLLCQSFQSASSGIFLTGVLINSDPVVQELLTHTALLHLLHSDPKNRKHLHPYLQDPLKCADVEKKRPQCI